jgi:nitrogen fixation protein FixH
MSYIDAIPPRAPRQVQSGWRWFPWAIVGFLGFVVVVNAGMMWAALGTFPGAAGGDGFDLSNHYDRVLDVAAHEAALGWKLDASVDPAGQPSITLIDRSGAPLNGARVSATAERPLGPPTTTALTFQAAAGRYVTAQRLPEKGQWDLLVTATQDGRTYTTTRRVIVR